jgi:hypothetical protein
VTAATTTTSIVSDLPDPSVFGEPVIVSFSVVSGGGTPTGTVTVSGGGTSCFASVAVGSCELNFPAIGAKTLTANYPGDGNFTGSTSGSTGHTVNQAATTTAIADHTPSPSALGDPVTVTWTVLPTAPGAGTPGGTVSVSDGVDSCNAAVATGECDITLTTVGTRTLVATYAGDANFITSASPGVSHTVNLTATATGLTSSANPSVFGQSVTFTATVTGGTPTGTVQFKNGVANLGTPVALVAGVAALPTAALSVASHDITAVYSGDTNHATSTSGVVNQVVDQAATTTEISGFSPPTADTLTAVTVSWSVLPVLPGAGAPTGSVVVTTDGVETCSAAVATGGCALTFESSGPRLVTISYQGDTQFQASASAATPYAVNP